MTGNNEVRAWRRIRLRYLSELRSSREERLMGQYHHQQHYQLPQQYELHQQQYQLHQQHYYQQQQQSQHGWYPSTEHLHQQHSQSANFPPHEYSEDSSLKKLNAHAGPLDRNTLMNASSFSDDSTATTAVSTLREDRSMYTMSTMILEDLPSPHHVIELMDLDMNIGDQEEEEGRHFEESMVPSESKPAEREEGLITVMESIPEERPLTLGPAVVPNQIEEEDEEDERTGSTASYALPDESSLVSFTPTLKLGETESINLNMDDVCNEQFLLNMCPYPPLVEAAKKLQRPANDPQDDSPMESKTPPAPLPTPESQEQTPPMARQVTFLDESQPPNPPASAPTMNPDWMDSWNELQRFHEKRPEWLASWRDFRHITGRPEWMASWRDLYSLYKISFHNMGAGEMFLDEFDDQSSIASQARDGFDEHDKTPWRPTSAIGAQVHFSAPLSRFHSPSVFRETAYMDQAHSY